MTPAIVPLAELCDLDRRGLRPDDPDTARLPLLGVENVDSRTGALNLNTGSRVGVGKSTSFRFDERHVLYAKLRPYLNKVATPAFTGRCSTELVPLLPRPGVNRDFSCVRASAQGRPCPSSCPQSPDRGCPVPT